MNPDWLLKHFEQISEAPEAVPRLRRFILDLAVRGKLVEQNPEDEPAGELLKRIEAEKERLTKAGELRKHHTQPLDEEQIAFTIPSAWSWTHLAQIGIINPQNDSEDNAKASFVPMRMIHAEYRQPSEHEIRHWGEIRRGFTHFADEDVGLAKITPCFQNGKSTVFRNLTGGIGAGTTELHIVRPIFVVADYILIFLKSSHFIEAGIPKMTGTAGQKRVPKDYFAFSPFPLPPLFEQHRIVAKVDELMALCDELEVAQAKRERRRDWLVAATLHGLNNGDASPPLGTRATFKKSAHFYFNHLQRLTTRPEHIYQLRQTILNLAVRGKLVPQDPQDEPASELLKRIRAEKERLMKEGKARRQEPQPELEANGMPFAIPNSWAWARLGDVIHLVSGQHLQPSEYSDQKQTGPPYITGPADFGVDGLVITRYAIVRKAVATNGQILLTVKGAGVGKTAVCNLQEVAISRQLMAMTAIKWSQSFLLLTAHRLAESLKETVRSLIPGISREDVDRFVFPLPPLTEQHRIVAKVDELMTLCDKLEIQLTSSIATRRQLLESTLKEALSP
jgi:type I restriction enzyme, S subunit